MATGLLTRDVKEMNAVRRQLWASPPVTAARFQPHRGECVVQEANSATYRSGGEAASTVEASIGYNCLVRLLSRAWIATHSVRGVCELSRHIKDV